MEDLFMNEKRTSELLNSWIYEQKTAYIKGWDFSHIRNRYKEEEDFSWDFYEVIKNYLRESDYLLDMEVAENFFYPLTIILICLRQLKAMSQI